MNETIMAPNLKKAASRLGLAVFALLALSQLVSGIASVVTDMFFPSFFETPYGFWLLSYIPLYLIGVPVFLLIAHTAPNTDLCREKIKMPANTFIKWWFISMAAMLIFNMISVLINFGIGLLKGTAISNPAADLTLASGGLYNIIFGVIVAPIGEEIMMRYVFYKKLSGYGDRVYIILSSICFAAMHGNISQLLYAFVIGIILAYIMARTRNILYCIALHMLINSFSLVLMPLTLHSEFALAILGYLLMLVTAFGVVFYFRTKKKGFIVDAPILAVPDRPIFASISSLGMILTLGICATLCLIVILI